MAEPVSGKTTKHTVLVDALKQMRPDRVIGFSDVAVLVTELPPPSGGTDIAGAIAAASCHQPARTLLISDGQPNDKKAAEDSAARLPGVLDVLYIGPETDREASDWLRSLAKTCCGTYAAYDVVREANPKALETRILALGSGR
jgi:hypothetical protein